MVRDGLGAKDVAHSERLGVSWKVADVATVAEVYSPGPHAMMGMKELPARRRTCISLFEPIHTFENNRILYVLKLC